MSHKDLTDAQWEKLEPALPPADAKRRGRPYSDHRTVVNGVLWVLRTGLPWRDLPPQYGRWQTVYSRYRRWTQQGVWQRALDQLKAKTE